MCRIAFLPLLIAGACTSASAADRGYTVTDFSRIRAEGPFDIAVHVGPAVSVRAHGLPSALDRLSVEVQGDTLIVRPDRSAWSGWPGGMNGNVTVAVTVPALRAVAIGGSGDVSIDRMKAEAVQLALSGSGDLSVGAVDAEKLSVALVGSGDVKVAGRTMQADLSAQGSGSIDAAALTAEDATLSSQGSGDIGITATRTAKAASAGSGDVTVAGPAACTVSQAGSGEVSCGRKAD